MWAGLGKWDRRVNRLGINGITANAVVDEKRECLDVVRIGW